jgi:hypothetical protein
MAYWLAPPGVSLAAVAGKLAAAGAEDVGVVEAAVSVSRLQPVMSETIAMARMSVGRTVRFISSPGRDGSIASSLFEQSAYRRAARRVWRMRDDRSLARTLLLDRQLREISK